MNANLSILFRCDGSPEIGLGHVVRCLALADELRKNHNCRIVFAMRHGPLGFEMVRNKGYPVLTPSNISPPPFLPVDGEGWGGVERTGEGETSNNQSFDYARWLAEVVGNVGAQALILDVRDDLPRAAVEELREQGILIVTLDDPSERRLAADLAFYPPVPQVHRLDWTGFTGQLYVDWEWVVLRREFAHRPPSEPHERPVILVTMGGSDPAGLTLKAVEALALLDEDFETMVVLGPGFSHHEYIRNLLARTRRHFDVRQNVADMPGLMARADLAVASFGVTAYELAAMGVPATYLCLTEDHAESASAFVEADIAMSLGVHLDVTPEVLAQSVLFLLENDELRLQMSAQASTLVDGRGAYRIADCIVLEVKQRYV